MAYLVFGISLDSTSVGCFGIVFLGFGILHITVGCFVKVEGGGQKGDNWGRVEEDLKDPGQV